MLYLAEVQKKAATFGVGGKAEFKLLACQRGEQNWTAVSKDEAIETPEANNFKDGALVLVDLANNKVQKPPQEAGRPLVAILQSFSRLQDKFKGQEEEIEQWKQSLTFQAQELNRREMEMQAREEELQQLEEKSEQLEQQRAEIEGAREESDRLREEIESNRQELEGAWEQLRGEQQRLEEGLAQLQQASVLDEEQAAKIQEILNRLSGAIAPTESVREALNEALEIVKAQQGTLDDRWQQLEQQRSSADQLQAEVDRVAGEVRDRWLEWRQAQEALDNAQWELKTQQKALSLKQEYAQTLGTMASSTEQLYQQLQQLAESSGQSNITVDLDALEKMPIEELQSIVEDLQRDLDKNSAFVKDQEEELKLQLDAINDLQQKISQASEYDRLTLENELSEEQEGYRILNESLVGSRRNLGQQEAILRLHRAVLRRRQGYAIEAGEEPPINLSPLLEQVEAQRQQKTAELERLESEIDQMRTAISQAESLVNAQTGDQQAKRQQIEQLEQSWQDQRVAVAELWGKVNLYQEILQQIQDGMSGLQHKLQAIGEAVSGVQETGDYQLQAIADLQNTITSLTQQQSPE